MLCGARLTDYIFGILMPEPGTGTTFHHLPLSPSRPSPPGFSRAAAVAAVMSILIISQRDAIRARVFLIF